MVNRPRINSHKSFVVMGSSLSPRKAKFSSIRKEFSSSPFFFPSIYFENWSVVDLQCCVNFYKRERASLSWLQLCLPVTGLDLLPGRSYKTSFRTSLVVQRSRICLPMQGMWVWSLIREDPTYRAYRAVKSMCRNYWAWPLEPSSHNKRSHHREKPMHRK